MGPYSQGRTHLDRLERGMSTIKAKDWYLEEARFQLSNEDFMMIWLVYEWPHKMRPILLEAGARNNADRKEFEKKLRLRKVK